ncbi:Adenylate cyclase [Minicystis rosea]|nr:Adenylate cyclase [Minicystis rosea]
MAPAAEALSPRQRDVLRLVARGLANKEVGAALGISAETVRTHLTQVMARLGVENRTEAAALYLAHEAGPARVARVLERPAIAVLPLIVPGLDPSLEAAAAGIARDLSDRFARWCHFPVIATASTIDARGLGATSAEIGTQLGARFLVDGMLRGARDTWRLSVRAIDAPSGHCLWADARDFPACALFEVQDEVCDAVVAAAYPRMLEAALAPSSRTSPLNDLSAWELAHRALDWQAERERSANVRAQEAFRAALARDAHLMLAHFGLGLAAYDELLNQWAPIGAALDRLARAAERCCELGPHMAEGWYLWARHAQSRGDLEAALAPAVTAVGHNRSFVHAHAFLGQANLLTGRLDEGLTRMQHACRLSPRTMVTGVAVAHFARGEHREGLAAAERAIERRPGYAFAYALAAACAYGLDDLETAARHAHAMRAVHPGFEPAGFATIFGAHVEAVSRLTSALEAVDRSTRRAAEPDATRKPSEPPRGRGRRQ